MTRPKLRAHPHLYEINTWPWLEQMSRSTGKRVTLGTVPDALWNALAARGIDLIYLMGLWRRSVVGRHMAQSDPRLFPGLSRALPEWRAEDVVGSAYCIVRYEPDSHLGTWDELDVVRRKLHVRGMRLIVDFVPNHTGFDHPWIAAYPDRFVTASEAAFRADPSRYQVVDTASGAVRFVACGRDPFFPPWTDVAQLNYCNPDTRAAMIDELRTLARHADGARCDMAMLVLNDVFARTWGDAAGAEPSSAEFWADARGAVPDFLLLAEVYWDLEWRLQQLGFDFTYDKSLYDRLLHGSADEVRGHLHADAEYQRRSARFIENHDEERAATAFGDRSPVAAVVISTLQGLRFFHDGQFEGRRTHVPVQLGVVANEGADERLEAFYRRLLDIVKEPVFHTGAWRLCDVRPLDDTSRHLVAWSWNDGRERRLVVVSLGPVAAHGQVDVQSDLPAGDRLVFHDLLDGNQYEWPRADLDTGGLYVRLPPGGAHIFRFSAE